jgi:hypothetical protein
VLLFFDFVAHVLRHHVLNLYLTLIVFLYNNNNSGVGKSCMLIRLTDDTFTTDWIETIGIDFKVYSKLHDDKHIKLHHWDSMFHVSTSATFYPLFIHQNNTNIYNRVVHAMVRVILHHGIRVYKDYLSCLISVIMRHGVK